MSRVGKSPISLPGGVAVTKTASHVQVKGPKGNLSQAIVSMVSIDIEDNVVTVHRANDSKPARANHGLMRALVNNMVVGVSAGFKKELSVIGVGYRAAVKGKKLVMQLGYSHPIEFPIPAGIDIAVDKSNKITVSGIDKQQVGQVSAEIRAFRKPDHYKGKGVRYVNEYVRIKQGKSA